MWYKSCYLYPKSVEPRMSHSSHLISQWPCILFSHWLMFEFSILNVPSTRGEDEFFCKCPSNLTVTWNLCYLLETFIYYKIIFIEFIFCATKTFFGFKIMVSLERYRCRAEMTMGSWGNEWINEWILKTLSLKCWAPGCWK